MTHRRILLLLFCIVPLLPLGYWLWRPVEVAVVQLRPQDVQRTIVSSGRVAAQRQSQLGSTISGRVIATPVAKGQRVKQGTVLLRLEPEELQAQWRQSLAQLQDARQQQLDSQRQWQRQLALFRQGFISQAALDAQQRLRDQSRLRVQQLQAQLAQFAAKSGQSEIRAPSDGVLLSRDVEIGDVLQAGAPHLRFASSGGQRVLLEVDERQLAQLRVGQLAQVVADAWPGRTLTGKVGRIAPEIDAERGTVEVEIMLDQNHEFLLSGMTVSAEIRTLSLSRVLLLPAEAIRHGRLAQVLDGRLLWRTPKLAAAIDGKVQVLDGLAAGAQVISPFPLLEEGVRVRVREGGA